MNEKAHFVEVWPKQGSKISENKLAFILYHKIVSVFNNEAGT